MANTTNDSNMSNELVEGDEPHYDTGTGFEEIQTAMRTVAALEDLRQDVLSLETNESLNVALKSFHSVMAVSAYPVSAKVALENYHNPSSRRHALVASIENQEYLLNEAIDLSVEDYTDVFGSTPKKKLDGIQKSSNELKDNISNVTDADKPINLNTRGLWKFIHKNGEVDPQKLNDVGSEKRTIDTLLKAVEQVTTNLSRVKEDDDLASALSKAGAPIGNIPKMHLLYNWTVVGNSNNNQLDRHQEKFQDRNKPNTKLTRAGGLVAGLFFCVAGAGVGYAIASSMTKKKVDNGDRTEAKKFLEALASLGEYQKRINDLAEKLGNVVENAGDKSKFKKAALPAMDVLNFVADHVQACIMAGNAIAKKGK